MNTELNLVYLKTEHNHEVGVYDSEVLALKSQCRKRASTSHGNLRDLFNDVTRSDPVAHRITFKECESLMFRARRSSQPTIPKSAIAFCEQLPTTNFAMNFRATITLDEE